MARRKYIKLILALIFIISGTALFIYPRITDGLYKNNISKLEKSFQTINDEEDNSKLNELYNILKQANDEIYHSNQSKFLRDKKYDIADINLSDYGIDNQIFGFIEIPSINITLPIYFGSSDKNMQLGATHLTGTSYPIGGINTNSVIAAHRGYYKTEMFRHIDNIKIGDKLIIKNIYDILEYQAYKIDIIKPNELNKLTIEDGEDMVTLISCHPFPHNYERYVVYFKRI